MPNQEMGPNYWTNLAHNFPSIDRNTRTLKALKLCQLFLSLVACVQKLTYNHSISQFVNACNKKKEKLL